MSMEIDTNELYQQGYDDGVRDARHQIANGIIEDSAVRPRNPLSALTPAQLAAIRSVILEVIDDGGKDGQWMFYEDATGEHVWTEADSERLDFCDEIQRRIVARGAPATVSVTISERRCKVCGELYSPDEDGAESVCSVCATAPATVRGEVK